MAGCEKNAGDSGVGRTLADIEGTAPPHFIDPTNETVKDAVGQIFPKLSKFDTIYGVLARLLASLIWHASEKTMGGDGDEKMTFFNALKQT